MKAAVLIGFGGVDQLEVRDVPEPQVGAGEVKVRVVATSINPVDLKLREGMPRLTANLKLPTILGTDAAGEVIEVGAGVTRLRVGSKVAGFISHGYAERVVGIEDAWAEVPESINLQDAAAVPLVSLTGEQLIDKGVAPRPGDRILVLGAVGSVGRVAVFTAKARGAKVWAGVRASQRKAAAELGVDGVIAIDAPVAAGGVPTFDAIADTVGGDSTVRLLDRLRPGGIVATVVPAPAAAKERGFDVRYVGARHDAKALAALMRAVADGELVIPIAKSFSLDQIRDAQVAAQTGAGGKVLVLI